MSCNSLLSSSNADLAAFWLMAASAGATESDLSGNGNDLTLVNSPTLEATGPENGFQKAITFASGSSQYGTAADFDYGNTNVSWSGWIKQAATNNQTWGAHFDTGGNQRSWRMNAISDGKGYVYLANGSTFKKIYKTSLTCCDNTWHHFAWTFENGTLRIFVDGAEDTSITKTTDDSIAEIFDSTAAVQVGANLTSGTPDNYSDGSLAAVSIHSTDLSATEVAQLAAGPEPIWLGTGTHHFNVARGVAYWNCPSTAWGLPTYLNAASTDNGALTAEVRIVRDRGKATEAVVATTTGFSGSVACAGATDNLTLELRVSNDGGYDDSLGDDADGWVSVAWYGLEAKLVGQWNLDEQSGTTAVDSSGNGNDGTYDRDASNTYLSIADLGTIDGGQDFNGSSDEIAFPELEFTGTYTASFWAQRDTSSGYDIILGHSTESAKIGFMTGVQDSVYVRIAPLGTGLAVATGVDCTELHHFAIGRDAAGSLFVFVDGVERPVVLTGQTATAHFNRIGIDDGATNYHDGSLSTVNIHNRPLTGPEIAQLYAQGPTALIDVGRVAHYRLEETSGTDVADSSASGNDGTSASNMSTLTATGMVGRGAHLDGTDYISAPWDGGFTYPTSVGCAFKLDTLTSAANRALVSLADASVFDVQWAFGAASTGTNMFVMRRNPGASNQTPVAPLTTNWHTAVVVFHDETSYSIYLDGTLLTVQTGLTSISASANVDTLLVGLQRLTSPSGYADGITLDEVSAWTRALSAAEAAEWHQFTLFPLAARHSAEPLGLETSLSL